MKKTVAGILSFAFFSCIFFSKLSAQQTLILRGRVVDEQTGETLSDANVFDLTSGIGVSTNSYGVYSLSLGKGKRIIRCSLLGYTTRTDTLDITSDKVLNFALKPGNYQLKDVEIVADRRHSGQFRLGQQDIQAMPVVGGESDLMKSLQFLPGVASGNEGANNISVRGSNQWGNLVLLDEAIVFNPNHALSFFSVFNNDAVHDVNLYKSYFPLNYGGRASSVIDVRMKEGNNKESKRKATVGLVSSKVMFEGPLKKDKSSYLVAARFAYPGVTCSLLGNNDDVPNPEMYFYDVNAKFNTIINDRNRIYFSLYSGGDHTVFDELVRGYGMDWGNATSTFRWNHTLNQKTYTNLSAIFSNYYYRYKNYADGLHYLWKSNMQSYQLKYDMEHNTSRNLRIKGGGALHFFTTIPGSIDNYGVFTHVVPYRLNRRKMLDFALYGEVEYRFASRFQLNGGIRLSALRTPSGPDYGASTFIVPEPRAELSYEVNRNHRLNISFNQASQNLHMLSNSSVGIPSDMWVPANEKLKPEIMRQFTAGYEWNQSDRNYTFSLEAFYRKTDHIIDFKDDVNLFMNNTIEKEVEQGESESYGVEFYLSKNRGALTGWASYTLSHARNRLANIRDTEYRPVYDRPHNLKLFLNYNINKRWSLSSTFSYSSGMNLTLPVGKYELHGAVLYIYSSRNGYRAPAFHQLDLSGTYRMRKGTLTCSIINLYGRKNVFSIYAGRGGEEYYKPMDIAQTYKIYLYGIVPSITYSFEF
ncbi:TonB-dependent receptor [Bacteroides faecis]|uniref:TonB-dependent receptor n=1 Tax=Bacteroides faecis TaxID=674529 RepID=UPI0039C3DC65